MKPNIHPDWFEDAVVTCACGHTFKTGSSKKTITVDICSNCHPFFTGEMKYIDIQGRVEKFQAKQVAAQKFQATQKTKKKEKIKSQQQPQSLREMLLAEKNRLQEEKSSKAQA